MKITNEMIPLIEKALGFTLYDWQRTYLLGESHAIPTERATGRTTAYIVKLLLTNREPINIKFEAMKYKDHRGVQYTHFFRNFMREIDEKLTAVGLSTCSVKPKPIRGITIDVGVDTDNLQRKLRAIAKHAETLADELDAIDNAWQCEYCGHDEYEVHETVSLHDCIHKRCKCAKCDEKCVIKIDDDLPTRFEGSE